MKKTRILQRLSGLIAVALVVALLMSAVMAEPISEPMTQLKDAFKKTFDVMMNESSPINRALNSRQLQQNIEENDYTFPFSFTVEVPQDETSTMPYTLSGEFSREAEAGKYLLALLVEMQRQEFFSGKLYIDPSEIQLDVPFLSESVLSLPLTDLMTTLPESEFGKMMGLTPDLVSQFDIKAIIDTVKDIIESYPQSDAWQNLVAGLEVVAGEPITLDLQGRSYDAETLVLTMSADVFYDWLDQTLAFVKAHEGLNDLLKKIQTLASAGSLDAMDMDVDLDDDLSEMYAEIEEGLAELREEGIFDGDLEIVFALREDGTIAQMSSSATAIDGPTLSFMFGLLGDVNSTDNIVCTFNVAENDDDDDDDVFTFSFSSVTTYDGTKSTTVDNIQMTVEDEAITVEQILDFDEADYSFSLTQTMSEIGYTEEEATFSATGSFTDVVPGESYTFSFDMNVTEMDITVPISVVISVQPLTDPIARLSEDAKNVLEMTQEELEALFGMFGVGQYDFVEDSLPDDDDLGLGDDDDAETSATTVG